MLHDIPLFGQPMQMAWWGHLKMVEYNHMKQS